MLEHDINVGNAAPIKQHPYRINASKSKIMRDEVKYICWRMTWLRQVQVLGVLLAFWFLNLMVRPGYVRIIER